ncbi:Pkinase-domain-containing protein [Saccharata proteae CBS 121410]|uniref:non-specific serine/threonine protein kinase n=1 Tax=Saccharata proteae CBS 121410 TaxID=1314787 RepID=A0A9P4HLX2_9PEZI|nr:Pkinase-domain-containing protein [Saccharata proteae CBS 121410]
MDQPRPPTRRRPLEDASMRANSTPPSVGKRPTRSSSPGRLPHNESLIQDGSKLAVRKPDSADNRRVSDIIGEGSSNRNSAISTASTNASGSGRRRKTHIGPWQLGKTIGEGGCSRVRVVRHSTTNQYGAAKIISKKIAEKVRVESLIHLYKSAEKDPHMMANMKLLPFGLEREIVIMKLLEHGNIVKLYDVWENRSELYLIMEYVSGGELFDYIDECQGMKEIEVVYLFRQIVAALLYCHRLHIHHRDLKPENILLDRNTFQIKLADFGMAALQPEGRWLTTPCGSPHYAAPEVLRYKKYDGGQADVWSCGVILFLMLVGRPPFAYPEGKEDLNHLFKLIAKAQFEMPDDLSIEAQDLIGKILVPDPKRRITIEGIWNHPFLHKYNEEFGYGPEESRSEYWIGPRPKIEDWSVFRLEDIDREILRNMRTLWHSVREEILVQKLLSKEANQEKYFYSALLKHREEHLENYAGGAGGMGYSASDYHHAGSVSNRQDQPPVPARHERTKSAFSILNNEHIRSEHSFNEPPQSEQSYDPFRASRAPSLANNQPYMNVTVHRGSSNTARSYKSNVAPSTRGAADSLRVETLKKTRPRGSGLSSNGSTNSRSGKPTTRSGISNRRSVSRSSMASSTWMTSASITTKPSNAHKRGVSFNHLRKGSSGLTAEALQHKPEQRQYLQNVSRAQLRSKKEGKNGPRLRVREPPTPGHYIEGEARKASTELERVLEEAFYRSSVGSSVRTSITDKPSPYDYDTPPSSVSNRGSGTPVFVPESSASPHETTGLRKQRPLPPIPDRVEEDSPNTFIAKELAETRAKFAARHAVEGGESYDEVLAHLDRLLRPGQVADPVGKRAASAPQTIKSPDPTPHLPIISEEGRPSDNTPRPDWGRNAYRAVTAPPGYGTEVDAAAQGKRYYGDNTIRLVDPSSPTPVAPLQIRKKTSTAAIQQSFAGAPAALTPSRAHPGAYAQLNANLDPRSPSSARGSPREIEAPVFAASAENTGNVAKKRSWFKRRLTDKDDKQDESDATLKIPPHWQGLDDRVQNNASTPGPKSRDSKRSHGTASNASEFPMRAEKPEVPVAGKKGFLKMFGIDKKKKDGVNARMELGSQRSTPEPSFMTSGFDLPEYEDVSGARINEGQNWLARFLHIKPASHLMCFQIGRGRARQELVRILREWRKYGIRDITFDRSANIVRASVDKENHLKLKPVTFVAELFVVLEHGRRAQLCIVRFTQVRGAASSFRRVVHILDDLYTTKGLLVEDEDRKKAMCEVLA